MGNRYLFGRQCRKTINPIMALYEYSRFKIRIDPGSKKRQGLHAGDVVRRQYADGAQTFYSLMVVLATGEDSVLLSDGIHASSPFSSAHSSRATSPVTENCWTSCVSRA